MEFYNKNSLRRFPFRDDSDLSGVIGSVPYTVPDSVFLDLRLLVSASPASGPVTVTGMSYDSGEALLILSLDLRGTPAEISVPVLGVASGAYSVSRGSQDNLSWLAVTGDLTPLVSALGGDDFTFVEPPELLPGLVRDIRGSRVISISDDNGNKVTGAVRLVEGYNCGISTAGKGILLRADPGAGDGHDCDAPTLGCSDVLFRINGEGGEAVNFVSSGPDIIVLPRPDEHTIDIITAAGVKC
jgi:hypothetical protein